MQVIYNGEKDPRQFKDVLHALIGGLLEKDERVVYLDADLMNCINTGDLPARFPERAIDVGIAEANMVGLAAGLSVAGFKPIIHSFASFVSRRCFDQIFVSCGYAKNGVTVIGSDAGVCAALNGGTHMPFEDMAMFRTVTDATVIDVSDSVMMDEVLPMLIDMPGVKYIRTSRKDSVKLYAPGSKFEIGKGNLLRDGTDVTLIGCGIMAAKAFRAAELLAEEGISAAVIDMFTVKPIDAELVTEYAKKTGAVVTAENHSVNGGLTEAVMRVLAKNCPVPAEYVAVDERFGQVGPQSFLEEEYGLTAEHIAEEAKKAIARK